MRTADQAGHQAPTAVIFPGQGTQRPGMGRAWQPSQSWPLAGQISAWTGVDVEYLLLGADEGELRRTDRAQLAVFTVGVMAHAEALRLGALAAPVGYAGHSLGEYTALYAAGALSLRAAAALVARRGAAMLRAGLRNPGAMAAVAGEDAGPAPAAELVAACQRAGHRVWVASYNSPRQVVLSGTAAGIAAAEPLAGAMGLRYAPLPVGGAFHSPLMAPATRRLRRALRATPFAAVHAPVVANIDGRPYRGGDAWPRLLAAQLTSAVRWESCVRALTGPLGARRLLELGPGGTLGGLARRIDPALPVDSARTPDQLLALASLA
jgi:[acyl-carrier-protein] S-malonyltransferase